MLTRPLRWGRNRRDVTSKLALTFAPLLHLSVAADRAPDRARHALPRLGRLRAAARERLLRYVAKCLDCSMCFAGLVLNNPNKSEEFRSNVKSDCGH
jgi:hypothetical protein